VYFPLKIPRRLAIGMFLAMIKPRKEMGTVLFFWSMENQSQKKIGPSPFSDIMKNPS
jgi:hypothetical protein